ncbi:MAG: 4Fe-4S binding protein [Bacillota bacterium]
MASVERAAVNRRIHINQEWCKGCGICMAFCRSDALSLNAQGKVAVAPEKCTVCAVCELFCPDFAITVQEEGARECRK